MRTVKIALGAVILAAASISAASAADMPSVPPAAPVAVSPIAEIGTGWYLRGDVGYSFNMIDRVATLPAFVEPRDVQWDSGVTIGGGGGFKAYWFRADVTLDWMPATRLRATSLTPGDVSAKIGASTALFNVYADLGTWWGFTPYIGAGVGTAYVTASDFASRSVPPFASVDARNKWTVAWDATAGAAYAITRNLLVDVAYRYVAFGSTATNADATGSLAFNNLAAHQIRLGLRWMCDDPFPVY